MDTVHREPGLLAEYGVLRAPVLAATADASLLAGRMLAAARAEADALLLQAQVAAGEAVLAAEQASLRRAARLLQALEQAQAGLLLGVEDLVVALAQGLFERLVLELTPRARIAASLRRICQEAPPGLVAAVLRVHPDDLADLPALGWTVQPDPELSPGSCRLEVGNGAWQAGFEAAVAALSAAFVQAARPDAAVSFDPAGK